MSKEVLLEIGTEELPVEFISIGLKQLSELTEFHFHKEKIEFQKIITEATSCRLILRVISAADTQIAESKEIRGPAEEAAFDSLGKPTPQAIGFARSQGIKVSDLAVKQMDKKKYVFAVHKTKAESTGKILKELLPAIIRNLVFPKMMRWGSCGGAFARPIRWILALWGKEAIRFEFGGVKSGDFSFGNKYLFPGSFKVKDASVFSAELRKRACLINPEERINIIKTKGSLLVKKPGGEISSDRKMLEDIANLVEYPLCLLGKFSAEYLKIPQEILSEVITTQEKCLPVKDKNGRLLPFFLIVANRTGDKGGLIRKGYERVMEARFKDAQFFYREDLEKKLIEKVENLRGIIFQEKLGSLFDKVRRLEKAADFFRKELNLNREELEDYKLASCLSKADLLTEVVREFPNLQGLIGRQYALLAGKGNAASEAIFEHYLPRFPGDILPRTKLGGLLSLADRIDTLVGYFYLGLIPSGSEDPYSLRRQANGLLEIILKFEFSFSLAELIDKSARLYGFSLAGKTKKDLLDFLRQRLIFILKQKNYRFDLIEAVLAAGYSAIPGAVRKLEALKKFSREKNFLPFLKAYQRVNNILRSVPGEKIQAKAMEASLLKENAEKVLYETCFQAKRKIDKAAGFKEVLEVFESLTPLINEFFDRIMVMVPEENLRLNRLLLLAQVRTLFLNFADFSRIAN